MDKIRIERGSAQESLVYPLYGRRFAAEKYPALFSDKEAAAVIERLDYAFDPEKMPVFSALLYAVRQDIGVRQAKAYLQEFPEATIVNLGCGLDTSWAQIDNGSCRFLNIDRQETLDLRDKLMTENDRTLYMASDVFDFTWMDDVDESKGVFVLCSGVFHYCAPEKVRALMTAMADHFPKGRVCFEVQGSTAALRAGPSVTFTVNDGEKELGPWSRKFVKIETLTKFPEYVKSKELPMQQRLTLRAGFNRGILRFVVITFKYRDPRAAK